MPPFTINSSTNSTVETKQPYPIRVALIGDSITELTEYPNYIAQKLGKNYTICNFGASGTTVSLDSYNPYMLSPAFEDAAKFQPDIAIVMLGTNDADLNLELYRGNFTEDYLTLLKKIQELPSKPQIWVATPPPIFNQTSGLSIKALEREIIPAIKQLTDKLNLHLIDVYGALNDPRCFLDGVHPNAVGAALIASTIYDAIASMRNNGGISP